MADEKKEAKEVKGGVRATTLAPPPQATPRELLEKKAAPAAAPQSKNANDGVVVETSKAPSTPPVENSSTSKPSISSENKLTPHTVEGRVISGNLPVKGVAGPAAPTTSAAASPAGKAAVAPKAKVKAAPMASIASRLADMMELDAGQPPASLRGGSTNALHSGFFHFMVYGEPNTYKTTTAAEFGGPEHTLIIVTRRSEQMIPLARKGFKFVVAEDADALRWALLHTEKAALLAEQEAEKEGYPDPGWAARWAADRDRVLIVDDVTEGTNVLKEDHMYVFHEKGEFAGTTRAIKDPRQAYKKAGDELHDYLKIVLGRQHVGLVALDKSFDVEGTSDNRTEPDMPNKMMKLVETELEYVFFFPHGDKMQTRTSKKVMSAQLEGKKETVTWNEIIFAKCKLPIEYLGKGVVAEMEPKNLREAWKKIQAAMRGDWKPTTGQNSPPISSKQPAPSASSSAKSALPKPSAEPVTPLKSTSTLPVAAKSSSTSSALSTSGTTSGSTPSPAPSLNKPVATATMPIAAAAKK